MDNIIKLHGPPASMVSDRDKIFTSQLWKDIFAAFHTKLKYSTAHHPETDGQTERFNQCLEQYLRCMVFQQPKKWCDWLPVAKWWYNCSYHSAIQMTPFQALYEYPPPLLQQIPAPAPTDENQVTFEAEKQNMLDLLQQNLQKAHNRMKKFPDGKRTKGTFVVGDMVYLKMKPYRVTALGTPQARKLTSKWYGPFRVTKRVGEVSYELHLPPEAKLHNVFHVSHFKKHLGPLAIANPKFPMVTASGKMKLAPIDVLQRRELPNNAGEEWLIQWYTMSKEEATWEDAIFIQETFPEFKT